MIHTGADNGYPQRDVHRLLKSQYLHRYQTLVVIHRHDRVPFTVQCLIKQRIGRKGTFNIYPGLLGHQNGRADDAFFFITELSRFSSLFVIGRKSAFTYKGKNVKAQEIGRDLGVHYFVEGSVRRAANWVRVTVQLIDSETGNHIWADRYDREMVSIFDLQDELVQAIVATAASE